MDLTTESVEGKVNMYPEIDEELESLNLKEPKTSFLYHMLRLQLLIKRKVKDKRLVEEMLNEMRLSAQDLQRELREMRAILEHGTSYR